LIGELGISVRKQVQTDVKKLASTGLKKKAQILLEVIAENPFQNSLPYEKWWGIGPGHILAKSICSRDSYIKYSERKKSLKS